MKIIRTIKRSFLCYGVRLAFLASLLACSGTIHSLKADNSIVAQDDSADLLGKSRHKKTNVTVKVKDDTKKKIKVENVSINNRNLNLKKKSGSSQRGTFKMQLKPGKYTIRWRTTKSGHKGKSTETHKKSFTVKKSSMTLSITGEKISIN
jgi:methionine-rich copper-binding protein CopC